MKRWITLLVVFCATIFALAGTASAGKSKNKFKPKPIDFPATVIEAVAADSITVTTDRVSKTYAITQFTEIRVNGQRGTAADLRKGMTANVVIGLDPLKASRIEAAGTPAAPRR